MNLLRFFFINVFYVLRCKCEHIYYRFFYLTPQLNSEYVPRKYLLFAGVSLNGAAELYRQSFSVEATNRIREADTLCEHVFELLGSGPKKLSTEVTGYQNIDWHIDFISGYRWDPKTFHRYISYGHNKGVDIKVPLEFSRFQHLNTLGQAYIITGDRKYSDEFVNQVTDWIDNNPVGFGVNWCCAMDVAIRAVNWLVAMEYFVEENLLPEKFLNKIYVTLLEHGRFIRSHLEYSSGWTTNHYLADIVGLFFIAVYCPFFEESQEWRDFALKELHGEIEKQVHADGCCFEASTSYHRLVLEMFFYAELLGQRADVEFSENYKNQLRKMFEVSLYSIKPNGMIPQIGDNDSGRFLRFSNRHILDHKYLLSLAAVHLNDGSFKAQNFEFDEEAFWVFGKTAKILWDNFPVGEALSEYKSFPNVGWYIIRHENDYCFISCGPNGGDGWHSHNDKLSFELAIDGHDILVDPGTYVYSSNPKERNIFRSTTYHNTIKFDGYEQNDISEIHIFLLYDRVEIKDVSLSETDDEIYFQGEISYADVLHRRNISFNKKSVEWQIKDCVSSKNHVDAELFFHLSPEVTYDGNCLLTKDKSAEKILIEIDGRALTKGEYYYSPEYGVKVEAESLKAVALDSQNNGTIITRIRRG